MHFWHDHVNGIALKKIYTNIDTQSAAFASVLDDIRVMFFICVHESVGLWTEQCTLLAVVLTALVVYHLRHIVHALPPKKGFIGVY